MQMDKNKKLTQRYQIIDLDRIRRTGMNIFEKVATNNLVIVIHKIEIMVRMRKITNSSVH